MRRFVFPLFFLWVIFFTLSCSSEKNKAAILWSDDPEFAFYCSQFNTVQDQYKITMQYHDFPARQLLTVKTYPDIVAGSWIKNVSTRKIFKPLDSFFKDNPSVRNAFYPRLLSAGNIDNKQYLLPVSFNAPVIIFEKNIGEELSSPFTIDFNEMKNLGKAYNTRLRGAYTRMGFSPSWDDNFLYIIAVLFNTSFMEDTPLTWDAAALGRALQFAIEWNRDANTGLQMVEDFSFKYFYTPPEKLAQSGRILFTYMDSNSFFTITEDQRNNLDFRWLAERETIPLTERSVYIGLVKKGKSPKAANAFLRWFFQTETQHVFLEKSRDYRLDETSFGISGGFSALRPVTELVFPRFYPGLLGRMPPEDFLTPANTLPGDWTEMKERVILPYLHDKVRQSDGDINSLERRLSDWVRARR